jgi:hypothetical protein
MTPSEIEPATFRLVTQFFHQLRHRVPRATVLQTQNIKGTMVSMTPKFMGTMGSDTLKSTMISETVEFMGSWIPYNCYRFARIQCPLTLTCERTLKKTKIHTNILINLQFNWL